MKKIFISHNQDYAPSRGIKLLLNMFNINGLLVEDEPGAEPPDKKAFRLLRECDAFLAVCTADLKGKAARRSPKSNVCLEIKEWQNIHGSKMMVVMKEVGVELPILLGNPTYCEFEGASILNAFQRSLQEFQLMGIVPYIGQEKKEKQISNVEMTDKELNLLKRLSRENEKSGLESELKRELKFTPQEWNVALHKLESKSSFIYRIENSWDGNLLFLTEDGLDYLLNKNLV